MTIVGFDKSSGGLEDGQACADPRSNGEGTFVEKIVTSTRRHTDIDGRGE
jgi:hypothetical protein